MKNFRVEPFKKWQIWLGEVLSRVNVFVLAMSKYKRYRHLPFLGVTVDRRHSAEENLPLWSIFREGIIEAVERHSETEPKYPQEHKLREKFAFSLIELMISLIAISLITAAFAPVISKRLTSSEFTIGVGSGGSSANMADWVTDCGHVNANCMYCLPQGDCQMCDLNCGIKYKNVEKCICEECNTKFDNCSECNRVECTKCETGYYVLNGRCTKTHAGSYSPDGINEEQCPEGYYCEQGSEPQVCPNGTYSQKGAKSESDCNDCPQGYACNNGTKSECSAGYYSKSGASTCTNCDNYNSSNSAYYSTGEKNNTCTLCEAGNMCTGGSKTSCDNPTYATQGSTYCSTCTNCTECDNKTGNCTQCTEGYFLSNNKCIECTIGYYCPGGSDSTRHECPSTCSSCTSQTNCTGCRATYQLDNSGSCNPCPEGYYCSGGTASAEGCPNNCKSCSNTSTCETCNNGYYINTSNTCTQCEAGYMCPNGQTRTSCDAGKYQNEKGQTSCKTCASATGTANTICGCSKGHYLNNGTCTACPSGTYQPDDGYTGTSCDTTKCIAGYYLAGGTTCTICQAGHYQAEEGTTKTYCDSCGTRGFATSTGSTTCVWCSAGYYTTQNRVANSCTTRCSAGYYCPEQGGLIGCPAKHYCPDNGMTEPTICPVGQCALYTSATCFSKPCTTCASAGSYNYTTYYGSGGFARVQGYRSLCGSFDWGNCYYDRHHLPHSHYQTWEDCTPSHAQLLCNNNLQRYCH